MKQDIKKIVIAVAAEQTSRKDVYSTIICKNSVEEALVKKSFFVEIIYVEKKDFEDNLIKKKILDVNPSCVFNLFEGFSDDPQKEAEFAGILEGISVPFTGNSSQSLGICLNKEKTKEILSKNNIPIPKGVFVKDSISIGTEKLNFPLFIKPCCEDASVGVDRDSLINREEDFYKNLDNKIKIFSQGVMVEEFIDGKEYNVGLLNGQVLGVSVLDYSRCGNYLPFLTYDAKWEVNSPEYKTIMPSLEDKIEENLEKRIIELAKLSGSLLGCKGYFRVDLREKNSELFVLDVNPNPDINQDSGFMKQAYSKGYSYQEVIEKILEQTFVPSQNRDNLSKKEEYLRIAQSTGIFKQQELDILNDLVAAAHQNTDSYFLFEEKQNDKIIGFIIFGRTPLTEFTWDIYWLVVDKNFQGKRTGKRLLKKVEDFISQRMGKFILRVETSARKEYTCARAFYSKQGFLEAGRIPDFYGTGDDLVIFRK